MGEKNYVFRCFVCYRTEEYVKGKRVPICCNMAMELDPLPPCTLADHAEMARNEDEGFACDDGRAYTGSAV